MADSKAWKNHTHKATHRRSEAGLGSGRCWEGYEGGGLETRGIWRWLQRGLSPTSLGTGRLSSDLTGAVDRSRLLTGSAQTNRAARPAACLLASLVPSGQPETAHTPAHLGRRAGLAFPWAPCLGPWAGGRKSQEMELKDKHPPHPQLLPMLGPAMGIDGTAGQAPCLTSRNQQSGILEPSQRAVAMISGVRWALSGRQTGRLTE